MRNGLGDIVIVLALSALCVRDCPAQRSETQPPLLQGVSSLIVTADVRCGSASIDSSDVLQATQLHLRRMGIRVVGSGSIPWFQMQVLCYPITDTRGDVMAYGLSVLGLFHEWAHVPRLSDSTWYTVVSWHNGGFGYSGPDGGRAKIDEMIEQTLSMFENDWLAANPKR
ncbi:MAG: hypothetical protein KGL35_31200 [Bradyrhizobium sp.]|nr:hypothetical protein [Bradyrhizobium sp.]